MPTNTPRLSLVQPIGTDTVAELREAITDDTNILDNAVTFTEGTLASRPAASLAGRLYRETDTGAVDFDTGSAWSTQLMLGSGFLTGVGATANVTASAGQLVLCQASSAITVTLPAATTAGQLVGVVNYNDAANTVAGGGSLIYGLGAAGKSSIMLGGSLSYAIFQSFNDTWVIVSGQQDTGWQALTLTSGVSVDSASGYTPAARIQGDKLQLCGALQDISGATNWATIPAGVRPSAALATLFAPGVGISTAGAITTSSSQNGLFLDGMWFRCI